MRQLITGIPKRVLPLLPVFRGMLQPQAATRVQRDASSWAPNPTASITLQPTDASLYAELKVPRTPGTKDTHLGLATGAAVGSNPHKQHEMNTLTCKGSPTTQLFLPKAKGMFQTPISSPRPRRCHPTKAMHKP